MGKALKGDSQEVEVVLNLTRPSQRHPRTRSTILNSSFVLQPGARLRNKVHPTTVMKLVWDFAYVPKGSYR